MEESKQKIKWWDRPFSYWQERVSGLFGIGAFAAGSWLLIADKVTAGSAFFVFGGFLFFLTNVDRFESFKAGGIEAKMREVKSKVAEAEELSDRVRKLTVLNAEIAGRLFARIGRFSGPPPRKDSLQLFDTVRKQLEEIKADSETVEAVFADWNDAVLTDLCLPAYNEIVKCIDARRLDFQADLAGLGHGAEQTPAYAVLSTRYSRDYELSKQFQQVWSNATSGAARLIETEVAWRAMQKFDDSWTKPEADVIERSLEEARFYRSNKRFKDPDYWISLDPMAAT